MEWFQLKLELKAVFVFSLEWNGMETKIKEYLVLFRKVFCQFGLNKACLYVMNSILDGIIQLYKYISYMLCSWVSWQ